MVKGGSHRDKEHLIELQMIPMFFQYAKMGALVSGRSATFAPIDCEMFLPVAQGGHDMMHMSLISRRTLFLGNNSSSCLSSMPEHRIMNALGSKRNDAAFYLLEKEVTGMKRRILGNLNLIKPATMAAWVTDTRHPGKFLKAIKAAIAVWGYLNDQEVRRSHVKIAANVRTIIKETENAMLARHGTMMDLTGAWDEWIADVMSFQLSRTYGWVHEQIGKREGFGKHSPAQII